METLKLKNGSEHPLNVVRNITIALGTLEAIDVYSLWAGVQKGDLLEQTPAPTIARLRIKGLIGRDNSLPIPVKDVVESGVAIGQSAKVISLQNPIAD